MSHTIQLPEDVYAAIAAYAARHGQTPEDAIQAWARALPEQETARNGTTPQQHYSARELMKLPPSQRQRILALAAESAAPDYEEGTDLRRFEATAEDDFYDDYPE